MQRNPAYYLLLNKAQTTISEKRITRKSNYILVSLPQNSSNIPNLYLKNQEVILQEHHFSIYADVSVRKERAKILSPFHYTATSDTLSIHVHFDCYGRYTHGIVKNIKTKEILPLTPSEEIQIKRLAHLSIQDTMNAIISELVKQENNYELKRDAVLIELEKISTKQNKKNNKYCELLKEAVRLTGKVNGVSFNPNYGLENYLTEAYKNATIQKKPAVKQTPSAAQEAFDALEEPAQEEQEAIAAQQKINLQTRMELGAQYDQPKKALESPIEYIKIKRDLLNQLWVLCASQDLNFMLSIIKKENRLEKEREKYLEEACFKGDIDTVKALLNEEKDFIRVKRMTRIAIIHQHKELSTWLLLQKSLKYFSQDLKTFKFDMSEIEKSRDPDVIRHTMGNCVFGTAYNAGDFDLCCELLASGEATPNQKTTLGEPILFICIKRNQNDFARKLLDFGANPALCSTQLKSEVMAAGDIPRVFREKFFTELKSVHFGKNALYYAAYYRNEEMFRLLLDLKKTPLTQTVFEVAMYPEPPLSKEIIEKIIEIGMSIDQELFPNILHQASTLDPNRPHQGSPLYFACKFKREEAVELLLELGADPFKEHVILREVKKNIITVSINPLIEAIRNENYSIALKIISHLEKEQSQGTIINRKELHRTTLTINRYFSPTSGAKVTFEDILNKLYLLRIKAYHQEAIAFYKEKKFKESDTLFKALFDQFSTISLTEAPTILYDYSLCLCELAEIEERNGHLERTKELIGEAIDSLHNAISIRGQQFQRELPPLKSNLFQSESITKKAIEKYYSLKNKLSEINKEIKTKIIQEIIIQYNKQGPLL